MPTMSFQGFSPNMTQKQIADNLIDLNRTLTYLMSHLDSANVKRLFTEYTDVRSKNGETVIDGPTLVMKAANSTTIRLKMGWVPTSSQFTFELYNSTGVKTVGIDSSGDATFTGTITGGLIRTASTGERIELTNNSLIGYNSTNQKHGIAWGSTAAVGSTNFADIYLYSNGIKTAEFYDEGTGFSFRPATTNYYVQVGKAGCHTYIVGNVHHQGTGATIGFFGGTPVAQTTIANLSTAATLGGTINKLNELIDALQSYNLV